MAREFDIVIIGAGSGGYTAALKAAEFGLKVMMIEAEKIGSTCVNRGCVPTETLLHASDMFHVMQSCDEFGVSTGFISFDFGKMQKYKKKTVVKYRDGIQYGFEKLSVKVVYGTAVLHRDRTVEAELKEGGREFFHGNTVIIATDAVSYMSRIPGADLADVWNGNRLLTAESRNFDRLTIMDGGVVAMRSATMFNNLCSHATIVEKQEHLMAPMDDVMSAELERELHQKGIDVYYGAAVTKILEKEGGLNCVITPNRGEGPVKMRAGQILMATGHRPNVEKLLGRDISLEMEGGKIAVNSDFGTNVWRIYAVGDVPTGTRLTHVAAAQGTYVVEGIVGRPHSTRLEVVSSGMYVSLSIVPNCAYMDPRITTVSTTEEIAREEGLKARCRHFSMRENGKSIIIGGENGFIRLVFEAYSSVIVGAQMMCPRTTDMIGEIATAIANGLSAEEMSLAMRAQPTYNKGIGAAIEDAMREK